MNTVITPSLTEGDKAVLIEVAVRGVPDMLADEDGWNYATDIITKYMRALEEANMLGYFKQEAAARHLHGWSEYAAGILATYAGLTNGGNDD